ncbi:GNAT family N-acetyltransferase [Streptomyces sp. NPDC059398]|uniref:GNAT family N-acetyltransferase n=1 Tax=Streptomyces sp. NPDC059398 TaxID=3346820 RepID=UPI0036BECC05
MTSVSLIRPARPEDIDTIAALHAAARATYYEGRIPVEEYASPGVHAQVREGWAAAIARPDGEVLCAETGGIVAAVTSFRAVEGDMVLKQFHVDPARWSRGIGGALHDAVVAAWQRDAVREARLDVYEHNLRAQRFYARHGWLPDEPAAGEPGGDHLCLRLDVPAAVARG